MKIGFSKNNSFFWVFTDGVWKAHRALQSETQRQRKRQWIYGEGRSETSHKALQGVIIKFLFCIHSQAKHRARCEHKHLWKLPRCEWRSPPSPCQLSATFSRHPNNHTNDCLGWMWGWKFLDPNEESISSWIFPLSCLCSIQGWLWVALEQKHMMCKQMYMLTF